MMPSPLDNYLELCRRVDQIADSCGRKAQDIQILAVSKGHSSEFLSCSLREAKEGQHLPKCLGENYHQELVAKSLQVSNVEWHFLGRLQSRKIVELCQVASCLHSVTRIKELELIAQQPKLPNFYIQLNISDEDQKNGVSADELPLLLDKVSELKLGEHFQGIMAMAAPCETVGDAEVLRQFAKCRDLRDALAPGKKLNMGMSGDFELAIRMGSNLIRIGTAIFGERPH